MRNLINSTSLTWKVFYYISGISWMKRRGGQQSIYNLGITAYCGLSVSYYEICVSCGRTVSFLFWNLCFLWANCQFLVLKFVFLVGEVSVSYFEIFVSCGRTVGFLFWNLCFLWAKCRFLILKFVFLVDELSVSYFEICVPYGRIVSLFWSFVSCGRSVSFLFWNLCLLWAKCPFLILHFVFLIGERNHPAKFHAVCA